MLVKKVAVALAVLLLVPLAASRSSAGSGSSIRIRHITDAPSSNQPSFAYTTTGSGLTSFILDDDSSGADSGDHPSSRTFSGLSPGTFTVTAQPRSGFSLTALTCSTGEVVDLGARRATITLAAGEDVVCTFTQAAPASVRLTLDVRPDDPADVVFDTAALGPPASVTLDDDGAAGPRSTTVLFPNLLPGDRTIRQVTELALQGLDLTAISCNGPVLASSLADATVGFHLDGGENLVCTFRNDRRGSVTIVEDSLPDSATDYSYVTTASIAIRALDDDADPTLPREVTFDDIPAGSRHLFTQGVPSGNPPWRLLSIVCDTGESTDVATRTATVTVDPGEDVTCTFANAQFQPDALIGATATGTFAGDELRSPTVVAAQTAVKSLRASGQRAKLFVKAQNGSGITDDLIVRTAESGPGRFAVVYLHGTEDVSAAVRSPEGFVFPGVEPGGERLLVVTFTARNNSVVGSARNADLTVTSGAAPAAGDVVRARVQRR